MNELDPKTQKILDERLMPALQNLMLNRDELADAWNATDQAAAIREIMKKYLEPYFPGMEDVQKKIIDEIGKIKDKPKDMNILAKFLSGEIALGDDFDPNEFLKNIVSKVVKMRDKNEFMKAAYGLDSALQDSSMKDAFQRRKPIFNKNKEYAIKAETTEPEMRIPNKELRTPQKRTRKEIIEEEIITRQQATPQLQKTEMKGNVEKNVLEMKQDQEEQQRMEIYNDELAQEMERKAQEIAEMEAGQRKVETRKKSFMEKVTSGKGIATAVIGGGMTIGGIVGAMLFSGTN